MREATVYETADSQVGFLRSRKALAWLAMAASGMAGVPAAEARPDALGAEPARTAASTRVYINENGAPVINDEPVLLRGVWAPCEENVEDVVRSGSNWVIATSCGNEQNMVNTIAGRAYFTSDYKLPDPEGVGIIGKYLVDEPENRRDEEGNPYQPEDNPRTKRYQETGRMVFQTFTANFSPALRKWPGVWTWEQYQKEIENLDAVATDIYPHAQACNWEGLNEEADMYHRQLELKELADGKPHGQWQEVGPIEGKCGAGPDVVTPADIWRSGHLLLAARVKYLLWFTHEIPGGDFENGWEKFKMPDANFRMMQKFNRSAESMKDCILAEDMNIASAEHDPVKIGGGVNVGKSKESCLITVNTSNETIKWQRRVPTLTGQPVKEKYTSEIFRPKGNLLKDVLASGQVSVYTWPKAKVLKKGS